MANSDSTVKFNGGTIKVSINTVEGFGETYGVPAFEGPPYISEDGSAMQLNESMLYGSNHSLSNSSSSSSAESQFSIPRYEGIDFVKAKKNQTHDLKKIQTELALYSTLTNVYALPKRSIKTNEMQRYKSIESIQVSEHSKIHQQATSYENSYDNKNLDKFNVPTYTGLVFRPKNQIVSQMALSEETVTEVDKDTNFNIIKSTTSKRLNDIKADDSESSPTVKAECKNEQPKIILRKNNSKSKRNSMALNNQMTSFVEHISKADNYNMSTKNIKTEKRTDLKTLPKTISLRAKTGYQTKRHIILANSQIFQHVGEMKKYSDEPIDINEKNKKRSENFQLDKKKEIKKPVEKEPEAFKKFEDKLNRSTKSEIKTKSFSINNYMERLIDKMINPINEALLDEKEKVLPTNNNNKTAMNNYLPKISTNLPQKKKQQSDLEDDNKTLKSTMVPVTKIFKDTTILKKSNVDQKNKRKKLVTFKFPVHQVISYTTQKPKNNFLRSNTVLRNNKTFAKPESKDRFSLNFNNQHSIFTEMSTLGQAKLQASDLDVNISSPNLNYFQNNRASGMFDYSSIYGHQKIYTHPSQKNIQALHYGGYGYRNAHSSPSINLPYRAFGYTY